WENQVEDKNEKYEYDQHQYEQKNHSPYSPPIADGKVLATIERAHAGKPFNNDNLTDEDVPNLNEYPRYAAEHVSNSNQQAGEDRSAQERQETAKSKPERFPYPGMRACELLSDDV